MSPRLPFLAIVVLALSGAVLASEGADRPDSAVAASPQADSTGTTWFCAGGTATSAPAASFADHTVIVDAGARPLTGHLTVVPGDVPGPPLAPTSSSSSTTTEPAGGSSTTSTTTSTTVAELRDRPGAPLTRTFALAAGEQGRFRLGDMVEAPLAAAVVEIDTDRARVPPLTPGRNPGGVTPQVSHEVAGPQGTDSSPCTSRSSSTWHFAWGTTTRDASERLVLFNPFPNDATVDAVFSTDRGVREPLRWQGLTVPARSVVAVEVGDDVTRRGHVAATLHVRGGRLVVDRLQAFDGQLGSAGLSVAAGVTEPATRWTFAPGLVDDAHAERIVLYNPGDAVADVEVAVVPDAGRPPEPFAVVVRPGRYEVLDLAQQPRVPWGIPHTITVTSHDGVPVVAERVTGTPATGPATPTLRLDTDSPTPG